MTASITPLKGQHSTRILVLRGSDSFDAPLECDLVETSLDAPHLKYEAISHCWADQKLTQPVLCQGRGAFVTRNVETALRRFRPEAENETRNLWIDSLCINQRDVEERNSQVWLMGEIYSKAEQVLIWLRNDSEPTGAASVHDSEYFTTCFEWMIRVASAAEEKVVERRTERLVGLLSEAHSLDVLDFVDLLPWFKRLWVVQEAALGRKALLFYNEASVSLESLFKAQDKIGELEGSGVLGLEAYRNPLWNAFAVHQMAKKCLEWNRNHEDPDEYVICDFVGEMRWSKTSEEKDKVYAWYGLLEASGVSLPRPDYTLSTAEIFREATISVIRSTNSIKILEQVDGLVSTPGLVSWVPDWSRSKHSIGMLGHYNSALPTPTPFFEFKDNGRLLVLKGHIIDTITARAEPAIAHTNERLGDPEEYLSWSKNCAPTEPFWKDVLEANPQHSATILSLWNIRVLQDFVRFALGPDPASASEDAVLELYYVLMSHVSRREDAIEDEPGARRWFSFLSQRLEGNFGHDTALDAEKWMPKIIRTIHEYPELNKLKLTAEFEIYNQIQQDSTYQTFHTRLDRIRYKTLFSSASGKLGLAPYSIQPGDQIALLAGIRVPMVVRREDSGYRLIAHVHERGIGEEADWRHRPGEDLEFDEMTLI